MPFWLISYPAYALANRPVFRLFFFSLQIQGSVSLCALLAREIHNPTLVVCLRWSFPTCKHRLYQAIKEQCKRHAVVCGGGQPQQSPERPQGGAPTSATCPEEQHRLRRDPPRQRPSCRNSSIKGDEPPFSKAAFSWERQLLKNGSQNWKFY